MRARPRHAEDQPASDRGETAPPSAPARARSVNTYARSLHGNIRAGRAHSLTCSADRMPAPWAADDPVGRAARPPYTIRQAHEHPQRAAAHRAALPARPAPQSCTNRRTTEHSAQHTPARAQHTQTRTRIQHAHAHSTRASHASAALHTEHTGPQQQQQSATIQPSHTRAHTPHCRRTHWASPRGTNWSEADSPRHNEIPEGALGRRSLRHLDSSTN